MSNIDKHALREAAEKATESDWIVDAHEGWHAVIPVADAVNGNYIIAEFQGPESKRNRDFVAAANPATVLALLDELDAKDNRINRLEAIVAVAEQRNALMREWKRALKVPCDLVDDQVPVVIHGMVIRLDRLKETEAKLEAAEKRIAEQREVMRQAASDISYAIYNLTGSDLSRLKPAVVESTDPTDTALIAERSLRAAAGKGEAS